MRILFYFGHPAQYLFLREAIKRLTVQNQHQVKILIKSKDVLEDLVRADGYKYINILPQGRGNGKLAIALSLLKRNRLLFPIVRKENPDLLVGTDASLAQIGCLLAVKCITITEDDYEVVKTLGRLTYPFTNTILCPEVCDVGRWSYKKVGYKGYMKLGYLHPDVFIPDKTKLDKYAIYSEFILIRLAKLSAHHDFNIKGLNIPVLDTVIKNAQEKGLRVLISSEDTIPSKYVSYLLRIDPVDMHHILGHATLLIADSQSMSVEAAILGIPSLRFSDFAGRISVLEELEHVYQLTYGFLTNNEAGLLSKFNAFLSIKDLRTEFKRRRDIMLKDKIDVSSFLVQFIENYPHSAYKLK